MSITIYINGNDNTVIDVSFGMVEISRSHTMKHVREETGIKVPPIKGKKMHLFVLFILKGSDALHALFRLKNIYVEAREVVSDTSFTICLFDVPLIAISDIALLSDDDANPLNAISNA